MYLSVGIESSRSGPRNSKNELQVGPPVVVTAVYFVVVMQVLPCAERRLGDRAVRCNALRRTRSVVCLGPHFNAHAYVSHGEVECCGLSVTDSLINGNTYIEAIRLKFQPVGMHGPHSLRGINAVRVPDGSSVRVVVDLGTVGNGWPPVQPRGDASRTPRVPTPTYIAVVLVGLGIVVLDVLHVRL